VSVFKFYIYSREENMSSKNEAIHILSRPDHSNCFTIFLMNLLTFFGQVLIASTLAPKYNRRVMNIKKIIPPALCTKRPENSFS